MSTRRSGRRAPVVLREAPRPNRRRARGRAEPVFAETLEAPLPGQMLVLLSKLHRTEQARGGDEEAAG